MRKAETEGFTLVEVTVSLFLFGMVMWGAYQLVIRTGRVAQSGRDHYVAVHLANNRIERSRNYLYENLSQLSESSLVVDGSGSPNNGGQYRRTTTVITNYGANVTKLHIRVEVRDRITGEFGGTNEEVISTLITPQTGSSGPIL